MESDQWIVVGTDFSDGARTALERALELAQELRASVALVHAYEDDPGARASVDPTSRLMRHLVDDVEASSATRRGVRVEPLVRRGAPWDKVLNVATERGAALIVVGRRGERGTALGALLGSVASRVLALSTRSVLVAPLSG